MKRSNTFIFTLLLILTLFLYPQDSFAQLSGSYTIPGTPFTTIKAAVDSLNLVGVGSSGVTFNVTGGHSETITVPITITATGTTTDQIIFQKSGAGANPLVTRTDAGIFATSTLGAQGDAVILIQGSDYLTLDGIDVTSSDQGIEYGYYLRKGSDVNGCKFVTIKNASITLTKGTSAFVAGIYSSNNDSLSLVSSATGITVTSVDGRNENVTLTGNIISNVFAGIVLRGYNHSATPYDFYDQNFIVGSNGAGNTIQNFAGNSAAAAYGVYLIYHNNANVSYNVINNTLGGGSGATSTFYGIFHSTGVLSAFTADNNQINISTSAAGSNIQGINNAATGNLAVDNNNITINTTALNTGLVGYIYNTSAAASSTVSISNNTFVGTTLSVTGSTYLIYNNSSQLTPGVTIVTGNTISGLINRTGATGTTYCYYNNGSPTGTENIYANVFDSVTTTGTGALYGILSTTGTSHTHNIYNNIVRDFVGGTGTVYGIHRTLASGSIYDNSMYNLSGAGTVNGLSIGSGNTSIYNNSIYNINSTSAATTGVVVNGMIITGITNHYIYNNFISDLKAPIVASTDAIRGINCTATTATTNLGLYYNTIFINASSTGANFGTTGIFHTNSTTGTTVLLDMRDNIVVNNSTPVGTGLTVAYRRSAANASLNNYSTLSNNNDFYAGTPGVSNLIFSDGTNSDQTISDFKTRVTPRESVSFSENPNFVNSTTTPYDLRINTTTATQLENGGITVSTPVVITTDFDGDLRNATTPDVGADEFAGIPLDVVSPVIVYTPLLNTASTSSRNLVSSITDPGSGVPTSGLGLPVLYWKINLAGTWAGATSTYLAGSDYQFNFGSGVLTGDTVYYYIAAQDLATTPNVGAFPSAGAGGFTSSPPAATTPPTTPSYYVISQAALAGDYTVGLLMFNKMTGKNIYFDKVVQKVMKKVWVENLVEKNKDTKVSSDVKKADKVSESVQTLVEDSYKPSGSYQLKEVEEINWIPMENGNLYSGDLFVKKSENPQMNFPDGIEGVYATITAAVTDLNLRGVSGATTFLLNDATYVAETLPIIINVSNEGNLPNATNTVTIKPNIGIISSVTDAGVGSQVFKILTSYITLDGSNAGGSDRSLTIENTSTTSPQVIAIGSTGTTPITNVTLKNCNIMNGANTSTALIVYGADGSAGYFNNIALQNNSVQKAYIGIYCLAIASAGNGSGLLITGNDLNGSGTNALLGHGIYVQGVDGVTVSNNNIANNSQTGFTHFPTGVWFASGTTNGIISGNNISNLSYTGTSGYAAKGIVVSTATTGSNINVNNNTISGISTSGTTQSYGIHLLSTMTGVNVENNRVSNILNSNTGGYGARGIHINTGVASSNINIRNNFVWDIKATSDVASAFWGIGIGIEGATSGVNVYYNSVNLFGSIVGYSTGTISTAFGVLSATAGVLDVRNNVFVNTHNNTNSGTDKAYAINSQAPNTAFTNIDNNDYYVAGTPGILGYLGTDQIDLTAWQTATGQDLNSINAIAAFTDSTNLHIPNGTITALESAGTPIAGITTDIDGQTRNVSTPDIGADEFNGINSTTALTGTYYIGVAGSGPGGTDPEFATLKAACDTLNISNVSGNTTFFITSNLVEPANVSIGIDPGSYTVTFKPYTGTVDTITFTQVADNAGVSGGWVFGTPSLTITSTTNYGLVTTENIIVDGSNTVDGTTRDLVVRTVAGISGNTYPFRLMGDVNNCVLKNFAVRTGQSVSYGILLSNRNFATNGTNWTPDNITVTNCDVINNISGSGQGIAISNSGTPTTFPTGIEFSFNDIVARTRGVFINYGGDANIFNNDITVNQTSTGLFSDGILTLSIGDTTNVMNIYNNKFTLLSTANSNSGTFGIAAIEPGSRGIYNIYNNMITGFAATTSTANPNCIINGIRVTSSLPKVNLYFNTIYMNDLAITPGTGAVLYAGIFVSNGTVVANNNIVQTDEANFPSYAIYRSGTSGTLVSDYNNFYYSDTTNGYTGYWNTAATKTLVDWQTASSLDVNSLNVLAPFASASDLHIPDGTTTLLESAGTPIAMVTADFDGQIRNASTPDIGADEFAGMPPIFAPTNLTAVADTFAILLNWTDNSANELGFYIERKNGDSLSVDPFVVIDTVGTDVVSYNDLGRTPNTTYTYRVQAYNLLGVSPYSNEVTATTIIPVELTTFAATANEKEISIVWSTATELNNRGFDLERKLDAEWQKVAFIEGKGTTTEQSDYAYTDKFAYESFQGTVQYRLKQMDFNGTISYSSVISVEVDFTPKEYTLYQNYPNPFNPSTTIKFALPFDSNVRIAVYNLLGEQVDVIFEQVKEVGYHNVSWNASSLASGVYFYTIEAKSLDGLKNFSSVKKMMLVK